MTTRPKDARDLRHPVLRLDDVVEALDTRDEVERRVIEGKEFIGHDIGDAVRIAGDVQADDPSAGREQIVIGARPTEDVEDVFGTPPDTREDGREVVDEATYVEVVELCPPRMPTRSPHPLDDVERKGRSAPIRGGGFG
jgi:hypothetical protein